RISSSPGSASSGRPCGRRSASRPSMPSSSSAGCDGQSMASLILAIDQGTTSSRAIVFDADLRVGAIAQKEFRQHFPKPGWVEHDPEEIWESVVSTVKAALRKARAKPAAV